VFVQTSRRIASLLAAGAWLILSPGLLRAQEAVRPTADSASRADRDRGPHTNIAGFRGIEFGASAAEIRSAFGDPAEERRLDSGLRMLAYHGELAGQPSLILFGLLDDRGFVKAQEVIDLAGGETCIAEIREIQHEINLAYPLIRPTEQARNNTPDPICTAAPAGDAFWHRQWRDESTGAVITVSVPSGSDEVDVIYESLAFRDWVGPEADARTEIIEDEGAPSGVLEKQ
jgi:hypothetical protein